MKENICCFCGIALTDNKNNALPIKSGFCCDKCNLDIVIPYRIMSYRKSRNNSL